MPIVALVLFTVFAALGFGWRSWEQRCRTGSTGFRGISGRPGSIEWLAGVGFIVSMAAAVFAPTLQLVGVVSPLAVLDIAWLQIAGIVIAAAGIAATVYAQLDMEIRGASGWTAARPRRWSVAACSAGYATRSSPR